MSINIQLSQHGEWQKIVYIGHINEDSEVHLPPLLKSLGQKVVVNFKQVISINSCGVRAWITFMRELIKGREIVFEECTPDIVSQINMIPNFKGTAEVRSLYGSYTCPNCGQNQFHLFEKGRNLPTSGGEGLEAVKCQKCGGKSELDELEEEFFAWVDAG